MKKEWRKKVLASKRFVATLVISAICTNIFVPISNAFECLPKNKAAIISNSIAHKINSGPDSSIYKVSKSTDLIILPDMDEGNTYHISKSTKVIKTDIGKKSFKVSINGEEPSLDGTVWIDKTIQSDAQIKLNQVIGISPVYKEDTYNLYTVSLNFDWAPLPEAFKVMQRNQLGKGNNSTYAVNPSTNIIPANLSYVTNTSVIVIPITKPIVQISNKLLIKMDKYGNCNADDIVIKNVTNAPIYIKNIKIHPLDDWSMENAGNDTYEIRSATELIPTSSTYGISPSTVLIDVPEKNVYKISPSAKLITTSGDKTEPVNIPSPIGNDTNTGVLFNPEKNQKFSLFALKRKEIRK